MVQIIEPPSGLQAGVGRIRRSGRSADAAGRIRYGCVELPAELRATAHPSGNVSLMAVLDNLAKGAAGAAVQNLNLMLDLPEGEGLLA